LLAGQARHREHGLNWTSWHELYASDLQSVYTLVVLPVVFLAYRFTRGRPPSALFPAAAEFVDGYAIAFALETIADPIITGPGVRLLGLADHRAGAAVLVLFVLLGGFRVYFLLFGVLAIADGRRWSSAVAIAALATLIVPLAAYTVTAVLRALGVGLVDHTFWLTYEWLFVAMALWLRGVLVPERIAERDAAVRAYLNALLAYVALYYALWGAADALVQLGGVDAGWLIRIVPNQLYYALWVPLVFFAFFTRPPLVLSAPAAA
jgi:hypothetical protein